MTKRLERTAEGDGVLLTCQSEGYPKSSVVWQDENLQRLRANTTSEPTPDQRYKVTSQMRVSSSDRDRYTCNFTNDGRSATFRLPGMFFLKGFPPRQYSKYSTGESVRADRWFEMLTMTRGQVQPGNFLPCLNPSLCPQRPFAMNN